MAVYTLLQKDVKSAHHRNGEISCYVGEVPAFVESGLIRLYRHPHSSLQFFTTSRPTDNVCTYVVHQGDQPTTIFVFQCKDGLVTVFNEFIVVSAEEVNRFARYIFNAFPDVSTIRFEALQTDADSFPFPYQRHNSKEDWVIELPSSAEEYTARLGKSTRNNIKYDVRRLSRVFPDHSLRFYTGAEIDEAHVRAIVGLSDARISAKKKRFGIDDQEVERIIRFARKGGLVSVLHIDGRLCAGMICQIVGSAYMAEVIAHDPAYNEYRLGALCYYRTICEAIARGATTVYMGGGREPYKARFLGVRQDMDRLELYRSHASMALSPRRVAKTAIGGGIRKAKIWLLAREKSALTRSVFFGLILARRLRDRLR